MKRTLLFVGALVAFLVIPLVAQAHTPEELEEWRAEWIAQVTEDGVTSGAIDEWLAMAQSHGCYWPGAKCVELPVQHRTSSSDRIEPDPTPDPAPTHTGMGSNVEQWRSLTEVYFGANTNAALSVMACESGGNPSAKNPRSTASGLFQHLGSYWPDRSAKAGWGGYSIFDPEANIAVAAWLSQGGSNWSHWVCKP